MARVSIMALKAGFGPVFQYGPDIIGPDIDLNSTVDPMALSSWP